MTKGEINLLYFEVEKLLNDICKFLTEEISNGYISQTGRSLASVLIERSKQQLQTISKVAVVDTSDCNNEPYVDMQGYKTNQDNEEPQEVYSDVSMTFETPSEILTVEEECLVCPYANLPANEIKDGKRGNLLRKGKILFFDQQKKVYASVQNSWLLIYMNENSLKPCQTFDLTRYEAKPAPMLLKDNKKREETFELISIVDPKPNYFTALTAKDMVQWVAAINKSSENTTLKRNLPPVPPNNLPERASLTSMECNDDHYEPLTEYQIRHQNTNTNKKIEEVNKNEKPIKDVPLPLPPRNTPQKNKPVKSIPLRLPSQESLEDYDFVGIAAQKSSQDNSSSFSDDDSDTVYDDPAELRHKELSFNLNTKHENTVALEAEEDEIYDSVQRPNLPPINSVSNNSRNIKTTDVHEDEEDEIYDCLEKPDPPKRADSKNIKTPTPNDKKQNEDEVKPKVKPTIKPKILSLKYRRKNNL